MPLSYSETSSPSSTTFTVGFAYININDIKAAGKNTGDSDWTALTVSNPQVSNGVTTVTVAGATSYDSVRVYRATSSESLVDFQNGSRLSESDLDTAYRQGLFAAQEVLENPVENITAVGPQGPAGADGADGADGQDGADGADGTTAVSGTFTPSIASTSGSFSAVGTCTGFYTKIGNLVHYQCQLEVTNNGSGSGNINVTNLPFTSASTGVVHTVNHGRETNINGSTFVTIMSRGVTTVVMLSPPFGNNANYSLNGTYRT